MTDTFADTLADTAPRYTSYPTAPHFHTGIGEAAVRLWQTNVGRREPVSLYVHIPFCDRLCWFCACHTKHTLRYEPVADYLQLLRREIGLVAAGFADKAGVGALHFGGGSPTMLRPDGFLDLMELLREAFDMAPDAQISVEIDPRDMDAARLEALAKAGVNRASLGIQDFDPRVQKAINRDQDFELTRDVTEGLRARGIAAINFDLVYGLPYQTADGVEATVRQALQLRPDRIALFGYAHVPWFKKHQTMIPDEALPGRAERIAQATRAAAAIVAEGYVAIGIDHFALPTDGLVRAMAAGTLRRNFQGYTDDSCRTLVGLGVSSVSSYAEGFAQNTTAMPDYRKAVEMGQLPIAKGIETTPDDQLRSWVIERLMCDFGFSRSDATARFGIAARAVFAEAALIAAERGGLLVDSGDAFIVPAPARPYVRAIAARFDTYLARGTARHSSTV